MYLIAMQSYHSNSGAKVQLFSETIVIIFRKKLIILLQNALYGLVGGG